MKEEKFPHNRKPSYRPVSGKLWNLREQHNQKKKKKNPPQNMHLTASNCNPSASSKWGLGREVWAAFRPKGRGWA